MSAIMSDPKQIPPTLDQVIAFFASMGSKTVPESFFDFYEERGWKAGRVPMKDWHAAARRWHRNGWGAPKAVAALTEWERKQKADRLRELKEEFRSLVFPGGSAYPITLSGDKAERAEHLQKQIEALRDELKAP